MTLHQTKKVRKVTRENVTLEDMELFGFDSGEAEFYLRIARGEQVEAVSFVESEKAPDPQQKAPPSRLAKSNREKGTLRHALKP